MTKNAKAAPTTKATTLGETASKNQNKDKIKDWKRQVFGDNSTSSQRSRILHYLRTEGPLTTLMARHLLDIMNPSQRVLELRRAGHPIQMVWVRDVTPEGNAHRVGQYILLQSKQLSLFDAPCKEVSA